MKIGEISSGSTVFVDSDIFVYHFTGVSNECTGFLERCERGELEAATNVSVITEVLYYLMIVEAFRKELVKPPNLADQLSQSPQTLKLLNEYFVHTEMIQEMGIVIRPLKFDTIVRSHMLRLTSGLMVNDSIVVASMKQERINLLATSDRSFESVSEIQLCMPQDL